MLITKQIITKAEQPTYHIAHYIFTVILLMHDGVFKKTCNLIFLKPIYCPRHWHMLRMAYLRCSLGMPLNPIFRKSLDEYDIAPGGALPSISCPIAASIAADAWALMKISSMAKGKTILWAWMTRGFLSPETAAEWHFDGDMEELQKHMKVVRGSYADLLSMKQLPSLDKRHPTEVLKLLTEQWK